MTLHSRGVTPASLDREASTSGADRTALPSSARGSDPLRIGRAPIHFFTAASIFFAAGCIGAPLVVGRIVDFFYQPEALALVHTFTLGWITTSIMGVMYRYVPALTRHPVARPRLALWHFWLFVIGTMGMIAHFALGAWVGTWVAAATVIISVLLFATNLIPCLYRELGRGVAETGMFLSIVLLLVAGTIGFLLALDKTYNFLGGDVITNLSGHVQFAALGWVTLTICAVSYRMIPAFLLPKVHLPKAAIWQLWSLSAGVVALGVTLLTGFAGVTFWGLVVAVSLVAYMFTIGRFVRTRRMPIDFTVRHALVGIAWLMGAIVLGVALSVTGAQDDLGSRLAAAYGTLGLLGWISNFIIGMSYQLFPGFVGRVRIGFGWAAVTIAELSIKRPRWLVLIGFNVSVALLAIGFLLRWESVAEIGAIVLAVSGAIYASITLWTLSYAYRRAVPSAAKDPLRIMPV